MLDFLLPSTDAGVAAQLAGWAVASTASVALTRRDPDLRLLVVGASILLLAVMAVRAVH